MTTDIQISILEGTDIDGIDTWQKEYDDWVKVDYDIERETEVFQNIDMVESEEDEKSPDKVDDVLNMYQASKFKMEP